MKNPYDVYSDNRAYHGYLRALTDVMGILLENTDEEGNFDLEKFLKEIEIET